MYSDTCRTSVEVIHGDTCAIVIHVEPACRRSTLSERSVLRSVLQNITGTGGWYREQQGLGARPCADSTAVITQTIVNTAVATTAQKFRVLTGNAPSTLATAAAKY